MNSADLAIRNLLAMVSDKPGKPSIADEIWEKSCDEVYDILVETPEVQDELKKVVLAAADVLQGTIKAMETPES